MRSFGCSVRSFAPSREGFAFGERRRFGMHPPDLSVSRSHPGRIVPGQAVGRADRMRRLNDQRPVGVTSSSLEAGSAFTKHVKGFAKVRMVLTMLA